MNVQYLQGVLDTLNAIEPYLFDQASIDALRTYVKSQRTFIEREIEKTTKKTEAELKKAEATGTTQAYGNEVKIIKKG